MSDEETEAEKRCRGYRIILEARDLQLKEQQATISRLTAENERLIKFKEQHLLCLNSIEKLTGERNPEGLDVVADALDKHDANQRVAINILREEITRLNENHLEIAMHRNYATLEQQASISRLEEEVQHWKVKATCYGNIVHGCSPALEAAGFPVDASNADGRVGGIRRSVESMAKELAEARKQMNNMADVEAFWSDWKAAEHKDGK